MIKLTEKIYFIRYVTDSYRSTIHTTDIQDEVFEKQFQNSDHHTLLQWNCKSNLYSKLTTHSFALQAEVVYKLQGDFSGYQQTTTVGNITQLQWHLRLVPTIHASKQDLVREAIKRNSTALETNIHYKLPANSWNIGLVKYQHHWQLTNCIIITYPETYWNHSPGDSTILHPTAQDSNITLQGDSTIQFFTQQHRTVTSLSRWLHNSSPNSTGQ